MEYDKENKLKFVSGSDKVCITFMAKNEKSNLRFFLNAPFGCTPARDTVNKEDKDNQLLMRELAILVQDVLKTLKEENLLTDEFFNMLPIPDDDIPEFYMPLVDAFRMGFKKRSYLPTMDEQQYVTVGNGIMSSRSVIAEKALSKIKQLQIVRGTDGILYKPENIRILKKKITVPDEYHLVDGVLIRKADAESFLKNIGVKEFTEKELEKYLYDQETSDFVKKMNSITAKDNPLEIARIT